MLSGKPGRLSMKFSIPPLFRPATWTLTEKDPMNTGKPRDNLRTLATRGSTAADHQEAETPNTTVTARSHNHAYLRMRAMVVSATSTDSSSGSSWIPFGKRRFSITTDSSLLSVLYSSTLTGRRAFEIQFNKRNQRQAVLHRTIRLPWPP